MKLRSKTFISFVVLALLYASINLLAAPPRATLQRYHVTTASLHLLDTTVVVPVIAIWFIALYGYQKLRTYSEHIVGNKDGRHVLNLTRGVMVLAYWLPISSTASSLLSFVASHHHGLLPVSIITSNYLSMLFPLVAFVFISRGSRGLSDLAKKRPPQLGVGIVALILIIASVFYGYLVANARNNIHAIYHLPSLVVLLTLAVPYIFSWFLGLLAAYEIHIYSKKVHGIIYRKSWNALALGIVWILSFSIALQYLSTVSAKLYSLSLGWVLALIYTILPIMAVGYIFVARGAKKLTQIEEV